MTSLTRSEVQRIRDGASYAPHLYEGIIRDLADTALGWYDSRNELLSECAALRSEVKYLRDDALRTAEARIARLEALLNAAPLCHMNGYNGVRCCDVHAFYERRRALLSEPQDVEGGPHICDVCGQRIPDDMTAVWVRNGQPRHIYCDNEQAYREGIARRAPTSPRQMLEQVAVEEAETYYRGPCPMCHGSGTVVTEPLHGSPPASPTEGEKK